MHQLILASQSPRRREILAQAGFSFRVESVKVSEIIDKNLNLDDALCALARTKAQALVEMRNLWKGQSILVLAADTVVVFDERVLGKPKDPSQARQFLGLLAGKAHSVKTAMCLWDCANEKVVTALDTTLVEFRPLSMEEIAAYVDSGEPMDKAGAYGIQGLGRAFVHRYTGSLTNVMGLPLDLLERLLDEHGWIIHRH